MAKRNVVGPCAMCRQERKLCRSHILPEFLYGKAYDEDGTAVSLSSHPRRRPRQVQVGAREHLLCAACEAVLNAHETYAAGLLRSIDAVPVGGQKGVEVEYDYRAFKLFGISLLWRAHVSTLHEYRQFSVGPLAEDMRQMLLRGDPGRPRMCPFAPVRFVGSEAAQHTVHVPVNLKLHGQRVALFVAFGYRWLFVTSRQCHTIPDRFPLVGFSDKLMVPFERTTDARFLGWLRGTMTPEMLG